MVCEFHLNKAIKKKNHLQRPMSGSGEAEINKKLLPFHGFTVHSKRTGNKWPVRRQRLGRGALVIMGTAEAKAEAGARPPAGLLQLPHALNSSVPLSEASRPGTPSTSLESRTRGRALSLLLLREPQARHAHLPSVHKKGAPDMQLLPSIFLRGSKNGNSRPGHAGESRSAPHSLCTHRRGLQATSQSFVGQHPSCSCLPPLGAPSDLTYRLW